MPYLDLSGLNPAAEVWAAMLFPKDEPRRRAYAAKVWNHSIAGITDELRAEIPQDTLIAQMAARDADAISQDEIRERWRRGLIAGEILKLIFAIAGTDPNKASSNQAVTFVTWNGQFSRAYAYAALRDFRPVIHLWAAWVLRGSMWHADPDRGYQPIDDVNVFLAEAMALLQWAEQFALPRSKAEPFMIRDKHHPWSVPPEWEPPTATSQWPCDGRLRQPALPAQWAARIGKARRQTRR
jgi:hypothetical protein